MKEKRKRMNKMEMRIFLSTNKFKNGYYRTRKVVFVIPLLSLATEFKNVRIYLICKNLDQRFNVKSDFTGSKYL